MKINNFKPTESSFLSIEKDLGVIVDLIFANENLLKLLYYTSKDALEKPKLSQEQKLSMINKNIKIKPKICVDRDVKTYIIIRIRNFSPSSNPEFRSCIIEFDICCHEEQWALKDFKLRAYRIAAELDSMLNKKHLSGIGKLEFCGTSDLLLSNEYFGLCLQYKTYHGEDDKKEEIKPQNNPAHIQDFKDILEDY